MGKTKTRLVRFWTQNMIAAWLRLSLTDKDGKQRQMFTKSSRSDRKLAGETEQINEDYCLTVVCLRTI